MRAAAADRRLETIAGPPTLDRTTVGTTARTTADPFEDITLFCVAQVTDQTSAFSVFTQIGPTGFVQGLIMTPNGAGNTGVLARVDIPGGSSNTARTITGARTTGQTMIAWARTSGGLTTLHAGDRKQSGPGAGAALTPASGFTDRRLLMQPQSGITPLRSFVYARALSDVQVRRVTAWLCARYGTPPPA